MGGGNIYDLQKLLGHSTVQVTERYTHLVPDHLRGKTEVLDF
jgi:site-specific recombinase XerD